jgi:hypothetical protein
LFPQNDSLTYSLRNYCFNRLTQNKTRSIISHIFLLSATISNILTNKMMMRSLFVALFALVLTSTMLDQTQALASITRSDKPTGIWGKLTGRPRGGFPAVPVTQVMESAPLPQQVTPLPQVTTTNDPAGFDADAYRREMTDLVYERSMQRFL